MDSFLIDLLVGAFGCVAVGAMTFAVFFRRLGRRGRVILGASLTLLLLLACLSTQLGAIRTALSRQASPSEAALVAIKSDYNGQVTLTSLSARDGSVRWRHTLDLYQTPTGVLANGRIYLIGAAQSAGTQPMAEALRLSDGARLWRVALPGTLSFWPITLADGLVIFTTRAPQNQSTMNLIAVSQLAPTIVWQVTMPSLPFIAGGSPLAAGSGLLFAGSLDGTAQALRLSDGGVAWSARIAPAPTATQPAVNVGLVARGDTLIAFDSQGTVVSLRQSDGATLWTQHDLIVPYEGRVSLGATNMYVCSINETSRRSQLQALDPATGATRWSRLENCLASAPIESGDSVYLPDTQALVALRLSDGAQRWSVTPDGQDLRYANPQVDSGAIYVGTAIANYRSLKVCGSWFPPSVTICHSVTYIAALDGATGAEYWRTPDAYDALLGLG